MNILFRNEHFVLLDKQAETLSVPSRFGEKDERPVVGILLQEFLGQQVLPVHRLDFEVSGLLLFSLTSVAHRAANQWFEQKKIQKIYQAISEGIPTDVPPGQEVQWKCQLMRGKKRAYEHSAGKLSHTKAKLLGPYGKTPWFEWRLEPITGRSHQLRYELFRHGSPIVGDSLYGATSEWGQPGVALRAIQMILPEEAKTFSLPTEFVAPAFLPDRSI